MYSVTTSQSNISSQRMHVLQGHLSDDNVAYDNPLEFIGADTTLTGAPTSGCQTQTATDEPIVHADTATTNTFLVFTEWTMQWLIVPSQQALHTAWVTYIVKYCLELFFFFFFHNCIYIFIMNSSSSACIIFPYQYCCCKSHYTQLTYAQVCVSIRVICQTVQQIADRTLPGIMCSFSCTTPSSLSYRSADHR